MQLHVLCIIKPRLYPQRILRLQQIRRRTIINYERLLQRPSQPAQVLYVQAVQLDAALPKQPVLDQPVRVQKVDHRIGVRRQRCGEDDHFERPADLLQKYVHARALTDENMLRDPFTKSDRQ